MRTTYLIGPVVLLGAFVIWFIPANARFEARLQADRQAAGERLIAAEIERKHRERLARDAHERRLAELAHEAAERERIRRDAERIRDDALRDDLANARTVRDQLHEEVNALESRMLALRTQKARVMKEWATTRHSLEQLLIERRNLDLELQHAAQALAHRVGATPVAEQPLFPRPRSTRM